MGRHRKFELGEIVQGWANDTKYVVVDYRSTDDERAYRCIPLDYKKRRRGDAVWINSWTLKATGESSGTASVKTFRANKALSLVGRDCSCQCCIHTAYSLSEWTNHGGWRDLEEPASIEDPEILGLVP